MGRAQDAQAPKLLSVQKIWDAAPHNAFTDLVRHKDEWSCVFREGAKHVSPDGKLRIITSRDGVKWESAALVESPLGDARDAKICVTPDGRLMLNGAIALQDQSKHRHQSAVWFSDDGRKWSEPTLIGDPDFWLWRVTWHEGKAYTIGYNTNKDRTKRFLRLYRSEDGKKFEAWNERLFDQASPGENTIRFLKDGTALCLVRRDLAPFTSLLGTSKPPYKEWTWREDLHRIGGPNFIQLPNGRFFAAGRNHAGSVRTSLFWLDAEKALLTECLKLPSGGDSSYPGLVWHNGQLWVSYYSTHETKTAIYLAKVSL
ncbi:MAG: hypothetical protein K0Q55_1136 [Verrucomicrobia bacterium]|jgi:hypothetical protein|nr:hypothetical protein [Verrucomicrobiota bacterium]